jgi:hypothetical protein
MTPRAQPETMTCGSSGSPNWYLDAVSDSLPFYESADKYGRGGTAIIEYDRPATPATPDHPGTPRVGGQTTMIDRPQQDPAIVEKAFRKGARRVERRARFHEYLIRDEEVLFENELVVQDAYWHVSEVPVRRNMPGSRGLTDKLQPAHYAALIRRRPEFGYFAHGT